MQVIQLVLVFSLYHFKVTEAKCKLKCEQTSARISDTRLKNRALMGHSFKNFTVNKPFDCYEKCSHERCRCQAFQIKGERSCELLDEDRFSAPHEFQEEEGYKYFDLNREYKKPTNNACPNQPCNNKCCEDNPCSNGGTCTELCDHAKSKFNCTCATEYYGKFCKKKIPTSCKQLQVVAKDLEESVVHTLYDPTRKSLFQTFCDFTSENGFVWTLLESFSLANNNHFKSQPFYKDYPVNQNSFKWNKFRLSLPIMNSTLSHSTHLRATCNFNTDGLVTTDYLRAKTTELNILLLKSYKCVTFEYINIRGYEAYNPSVSMIQVHEHLHTDSHKGGIHCSFDSAKNGSIGGSGEDNFGLYGTVNHLHRCSSGNSSTTQWWFGEQ
ncbi:PREDICTED: uncharacterized protein LOC107345255 [Acropora digitifera]|uniref:uncharacterized protein LOC107345255 n=1 Tax=Acropora digitifera TaxID=70779 RepID=UPI00077B0D12|nr:PREDICTED: uncharacterized protein LOC107345255 [Acropora digitifera]